MGKIELPHIPENERTPLIDLLLSLLEQSLQQNQKLSEEINILKAEIARLNKRPGRPNIKPSKMDKDDDDKEPPSGQENSKVKRPGSSKKSKKDNLEIHETMIVKVENLPDGSRFKGYRDFDVQDLHIQLKNTRYRLATWQLPNGEYVTAKLPSHLVGNHFGITLRSYILHQYHHLQVTQPLLLEQLMEFGVDISSGELNNILTEKNDLFHEEKEALLEVGLSSSDYVHVDDTGARHKGKNGYCTNIGNEFFAYFASRQSKSRINFLELLRMNNEDYVVGMPAVRHYKQQRLPSYWLNKLKRNKRTFPTKERWDNYLKKIGMKNNNHQKIATEGALLNSALTHGLSPELIIVSDDAGQFNVRAHALCWIHAERALTKIVPGNDLQAEAIENIKDRFWTIYRDLKKYKLNPTKEFRRTIHNQFNDLCKTSTCCIMLNKALQRLKRNKPELLLVLKHPKIPIQNNPSENDIREFVKRRKISGGTRSQPGRESRDTYASLKKTCRKLGISFWDYLNDRISKSNTIPQLSILLNQAITADTNFAAGY